MLTLVLFCHVLLPEAGVAGTAWLQDRFDGSSGPGKEPVALASYIYGAANALVYLSIPVGGLIGDLLLGRRAAVLTGGASMIAGLLMMISSSDERRGGTACVSKVRFLGSAST